MYTAEFGNAMLASNDHDMGIVICYTIYVSNACAIQVRNKQKSTSISLTPNK
ncbi:hypothetical protein HanIR_Chr13g0658661 [Helianthus annuus]|nr:hypothetical protein HanIR_Chr13g0658661 [Helianthus annuus]